MKTTSRARPGVTRRRDWVQRPVQQLTLVCHYARGKLLAAVPSLSSAPPVPTRTSSAQKNQVVGRTKK